MESSFGMGFLLSHMVTNSQSPRTAALPLSLPRLSEIEILVLEGWFYKNVKPRNQLLPHAGEASFLVLRCYLIQLTVSDGHVL